MSQRDEKATEQDSGLDQAIEDLDAGEDAAAQVVGGAMMIDATAVTDLIG